MPGVATFRGGVARVGDGSLEVARSSATSPKATPTIPANPPTAGTTTPAAPALEVVAAGLADAVEEPDEADDLDDDPDPEGLTWVVTGGTEEVREPVVLALLALVVREDEDEDP
ncbi:hypothetical protein MBLNU459_g2584t1 [Dothideomycetes sp. NU459]